MAKMLLIISIFWLIPPSSLAQEDPIGIVQAPSYIDVGDNAVQNFIPTIANIFFVVGLIGLLAYIALGGIRWIMAGGDPKAIAAAKSTLTQAVVGFILLSIAFAVAYIIDVLTGSKLLTGNTSNRNPYYICGYGEVTNQQCSDPALCPQCNQPRYVSDAVYQKMQNASPGTFCFTPEECHSGCLSNHLAGQQSYCFPANRAR